MASPENTSEEDSSIPGGGWGNRKRSLKVESCQLPTFDGDHSRNKKCRISTRDAEAAVTHRRKVGTSGIAGQQYVVKTATLALLNALLAKRRGHVDNFWLGANVDGLGASDNIVMKYTTRGRLKVIFVQCKHRDNLTKKVNLNDILKEDGDFGLLKLLDSYLSIMQMCDKGDDPVLKGSDENIEILMYTPAAIDFVYAVERLEVDNNDFFFTNEAGNIFKFKDNDQRIENLLKVLSNRHAKQLAKILANCVLSGTGNELMSNYLIKIYHVYLRNYVLKVSDAKFSFRAAFFDIDSEDFYVSRFRKYLYEQILNCKTACEITKVNLNDIKDILNTSLLVLPSDQFDILENKSEENKLNINDLRGILNKHAATPVVDKIVTDIMIKNLSRMQTITVPNTFGNIDLIVTKESQLDDLSVQFIKILQDHDITSTDGNVRIESKHIGYNKLLTKEDMQIGGGIGGLVGNLLILDPETNLLKLDTQENTLPANARKVLIKLKDIISKDGLNLDLSRYRFQFNIHGFPRVSWDKEADRRLLTDFISKFKFYSSQLKEEDMDNTIKKKMINYYNTDFNIHKTFLAVLHKLQSWWKTKGRVAYLTESCNYFNEADKPDLLSMFKFIHTNEVNSQHIEFSATALQSLGIDNFMKHTQHQILNIITNNLTLSTMKVLQYFTTNDTLRYNFSIIDMKYVYENNSYNDMLEELRNTQIENIIVKSAEFEFDDKLNSLCKELSDSKKKYFVITDKKLPDIPNYIRDERNTFLDLSQESKTKLLDNTRILFQEEEINLKGLLINEECQSLIDVNVLNEIISKGRITVGKPLADEKYNIIKDFYIDRRIHRCINIKKEFIMNDSQLNNEKMKNLIITYNKYIDQPNNMQYKDILLVSDDVKDFEQLCAEYRHCIHWFQKKYHHYIWKQSRGSLYNIRDYVERDERSGKSRLLNTMADVEDKPVIIAAGPGMGKTSLLTHLSISTKRMCPSTWIVRINLLDHSDSFLNWKNNHVNVNKETAFSFLATIIRSTHSETPLSIFEKRLFDQYYRSGKVALIFDGYDEISPDYKDQVIELIVNLNTAMTNTIWVATRPYDIQSELENSLSAFSFTLKTFSKDDQRDFLNRYCRSQSMLADVILGYMDPEMQTLLATPLHLSMIVIVSQNKNDGLVNTISDLHNVYKEFIDIKIEIYIVDKLQISKETRSSLIDNEYINIISYHKTLAIAALCPRDEVSRILNEQERETLNQLIEIFKNEEEKTGIVERVIDDTPRFVHITFAEYFVVEYFCDKLKSGTVSDIICKLLLNNRNIRKFFNSKIANDSNLVELCSNYEFSEKILEFSYDEKILLLSIAMKEKLKYLVKFYSKVTYTVLRESNFNIIINFAYRYRLFEDAFVHNHVSLVSDMLDAPAFENPLRNISGRLELLVHILKSAITCLEKYQLIVAFTSILDKILRKGYQLEEMLVCIFSDKIYSDMLYRSLIADHFIILMLILAKLSDEQLVRVATVCDKDGCTLVYNVVLIHKYKCEILHYFMKRLNKTRFRTICLTATNYGETPILRLFIELTNDKTFVNDYLSLCEYICPSDDEEATEFDEDRLRNMYVIASTCKSLFIGTTGWFVTRMLEDVQHYCGSSNKDDVHFGVKLLHYAVASNNEIIIHALLHNVKDTDRIMETMMAPCHNMAIVIIENIVRHDINIDLLPLEPLSPEQLVRLVCTAKKFKFFIKHLNRLNSDQLVQIITDADFTGRTIIHKAAARQDFGGNDSFTCHLRRLSTEQLVKITTVVDDFGWTPVLLAAEVRNLSFFEYLKNRLNDRNYFRRICLKEYAFQPVIVRFVRYKITETYSSYSSLCEYICPSNDEREAEFNESSLRNMYLIAATCKSLFERRPGWFITKMLKDIKEYFNSDNEDDVDFGVRLLYYAITCDNEPVMNTLLEDVTDAGCITNVLMRFIIGKSIFLGHHEINSQVLRFKLRSLHYKQPMRVADFIYRNEFSHANKIAKPQKIMLFNLLKGRLIKNDFRTFCFTTTYQDMLLTREKLILSLLHDTDTNDDAYITGYSSLCEYICPSADEVATDFNGNCMRDMYMIAATCNFLFTLNRGWFMSKMLEEVTCCCDSNNSDLFHFATMIISYSMQCKNEVFIGALFQNISDTDRITRIMMAKCQMLPCNRHRSNGETILHYAMRRNISCEVLRLDQLNAQQLLLVADAVDDKGDTPAHVATQQKHFNFVYLLKNSLDIVTFTRLCFQCNKSEKTILRVLCDNDMCMEADEECIGVCASLCEYIFPGMEDGDEIDECYSHYMCMLLSECERLFIRIKQSKFVKNMLDKIIKHNLDSDGIDYYRSDIYMHTARRSGNGALLNAVSAINTNEWPMDIVSAIFGHLNVSNTE